MGKDAKSRLYTEAEVSVLFAKIEALEARIAQLEKNSRTSSKPPSSDITKPPSSGSGKGSGASGGGGVSGGKRRKPGGQ